MPSCVCLLPFSFVLASATPSDPCAHVLTFCAAFPHLTVAHAQLCYQPDTDVSSFPSSISRPGAQSGPSGIAQLRKSSQANAATAAQNPDQMNIDEFIFPEQTGSPSAFASPQMPGTASTATAAQPSGMPIQQQPRSEGLGSAFVPQSVPDAPHLQHRGNSEFNYVQRHVRKTSIDERQVSLYPCLRTLSSAARAHCLLSTANMFPDKKTSCQLLSPYQRCRCTSWLR